MIQQENSVFAERSKIGNVVIYWPTNCPYKAVAQICTVKNIYGAHTEYFVYFDYLLEDGKEFCADTMQGKNILFIGGKPSKSVNIGSFPLHHKISVEEFEQRIDDSANELNGVIGAYFGYVESSGFDYTLYKTMKIYQDKKLPERLLNQPNLFYAKKHVEYNGVICGAYSQELSWCPYRELKYKIGDLFRIPLSNGDFCVGQLLYYDLHKFSEKELLEKAKKLLQDYNLPHSMITDSVKRLADKQYCSSIIGPVIGVFHGKEAAAEKLITIAAIMPTHFYWNLWEIYDNCPPVIDYDFTSESGKNWKGWYRYPSGHIQQFAEACHGLSNWQKGRFDEILFNSKMKPPDVEEIEVEFEQGLRKPLFTAPEDLNISPEESSVNSTMLSPSRFWKIIAESREKATGDSEKQMKILTEILLKANKEEIEKFNNRFYRCFFKAYTWELWGAAFVALGGCSDDAFMDFRGWLIAQGKTVFETALKAPESLSDYAPLENPGIMEGFSYCASDAYEELGYGSLEYGIMPIFEPKGKEWTEEELPELYPRLWQKFS